jgi:hypothetical protein
MLAAEMTGLDQLTQGILGVVPGSLDIFCQLASASSRILGGFLEEVRDQRDCDRGWQAAGQRWVLGEYL